MATIYTRKNGTFQLRIVNKLLPKDLWATFDTYEAAEQFAKQLEGLLAQGIVPSSRLERNSPKREHWTVQRCIVEYVRDNAVPVSEIKLLDTLMPSVARISSATLTYNWADAWVLEMKRKHNLAPSTIRHRHGALARCFDWMLRKHPEIMAQNPLRLLKRGFASYTEADAAALALSGREARVDVERDRRLADGQIHRPRSRELRSSTPASRSRPARMQFLRECDLADIWSMTIAPMPRLQIFAKRKWMTNLSVMTSASGYPGRGGAAPAMACSAEQPKVVPIVDRAH